MKYDIQIAENMIGGRQGYAWVCNSGEVKVLTADFEAPQEYEDYKEYGKAKVIWNYRGHESHKTCTLACENGTWELTSGGTFISGSFGYHDLMEMVEEAQLQVLRPDDTIAIVTYTSKAAMVKLYKLGKVDIHCSIVAHLIELTEEEMADVKIRIENWLRR